MIYANLGMINIKLILKSNASLNKNGYYIENDVVNRTSCLSCHSKSHNRNSRKSMGC